MRCLTSSKEVADVVWRRPHRNPALSDATPHRDFNYKLSVKDEHQAVTEPLQ